MGRAARSPPAIPRGSALKLTDLPLPGAWLLQIEPVEDERGFFARTFDAEQMAAVGIDGRVAQTSISWNPRRGTLRGVHHQAEPNGEGKLIRCTRGAVHDVLVDLRPDRPTHRHWWATELSADNRLAVYAPPGVAHGFLTLTEDAEVAYQMSVPYHAESARGVRWDDPAIGIEWPARPTVISAKDASLPLLEP